MHSAKPSHTHDHTAEFATGCKSPRFDMTLANKSALSSETVRESSIMHDAEDGHMMVSEDEKSHTKKVLIENIDMVHDLCDVDTESPSTSAMRPTSTEIVQETKEETVKRVVQLLVSEGVLPDGKVDCQAVAEQTTDAEIEGLTGIELQHVFAIKMFKMYRCYIDKHTLNAVLELLGKYRNLCEIEALKLKNQLEILNKLKYYYNCVLEATKPNNLDQRLPSTAGMSGGQENRKEEAHNKTSAKRIHKKSTAVNDLNAMKRNRCQLKTGSGYTKSGKGTSKPPKPVTNMEKKKTNTTTQAEQVRTKRCIEVIDLTIDDD